MWSSTGFANKLSLSKKSRFLPSQVCESFYLKVIQPSITFAMPAWGSVSQTELNHLKDNTAVLPGSYLVLSRICQQLTSKPPFPALIQLFYKGYLELFPHALAEQFIIHSNRSVSRTKHWLIAQRFASNYV